MPLPDYNHVERIYATGTGNIAASVLPTVFTDRGWFLLYARCHFTGNAGTATITLSVNSPLGSAYDTALTYTSAIGTGADWHLQVDEEERQAFQFGQGEPCTVDWTNPDSGNITYGLEVGICPARTGRV